MSATKFYFVYINCQRESCRRVHLLFIGINSAWGNRSLYAKFGWQV